MGIILIETVAGNTIACPELPIRNKRELLYKWFFGDIITDRKRGEYAPFVIGPEFQNS
jgi:hypothetical protein